MSIAGELARAVAPNLMRRRWIRQMSAGEQELRLLNLLTTKTGISIDVGANRGLYVEHLLPISGEVIAFEPLPDMQGVLRKFYPALRLEKVALSEAEGTATIRLPKANPSWATLSPTNALELAREEIVSHQVPVRTLDSYNLHNVSFIKIDVEGFEEAVLAGARQTIAREAPTLLVEIEDRHNHGSVGRVLQSLADLSYAAYFLDQPLPSLRPAAGFDLARDQPLHNVGVGGKSGRYINNFIFVPTAKAALFEASAAKALGN